MSYLLQTYLLLIYNSLILCFSEDCYNDDEDEDESGIDCGGETCRPCGKFFITSEISVQSFDGQCLKIFLINSNH